jgi:hypothetical protein
MVKVDGQAHGTVVICLTATLSGPSHFSKPVIGTAYGGMIALSLLLADVGVISHGVDIGHFADPHMLKETQTMTP